jgi:hypothetical protein
VQPPAEGNFDLGWRPGGMKGTEPLPHHCFARFEEIEGEPESEGGIRAHRIEAYHAL